MAVRGRAPSRRVSGTALVQSRIVDAAVLRDLFDFKLPALAQSGLSTTGAQIVLASRSGFTERVRDLAADTPTVRLLDASVLLSDLRSGTVTPG